MEKYCFVLASSDDRTRLLEKCVKSIKESQYANADVYLYYQGVKPVPCESFFSGIIRTPELMGIFIPRYELFRTFSKDYDYTILIDDDIFFYPYTSYATAISFCDFNKACGCVSLGRHFDKIRSEVRMIDYKKEDFNVNGGLVFPKECIDIILDYFKDRIDFYTEDMFWLLLYVKGYDLYRDFTSNAIHVCNQKGNDGQISGFRKMRYEKPRKALLPEYVTERFEYSRMHKMELYKIPETRDVNTAGIAERKRCRALMGIE